MASSEIVAQADRAFVEEDYETAISLYGKASDLPRGSPIAKSSESRYKLNNTLCTGPPWISGKRNNP